jgi:cobalt-zinc-cadmium efflux system protein
VWRISQGFDAVTAHVVLERGHHGVDVCRAVADRLRREHGLSHATIQPEAAAPHDTVPVRRAADGEPLQVTGGPSSVAKQPRSD